MVGIGKTGHYHILEIRLKLVVEGVLKKSYLYRKPTVGRKRKHIMKNKSVTLIFSKKKKMSESYK